MTRFDRITILLAFGLGVWITASWINVISNNMSIEGMIAPWNFFSVIF